MKIYYTDEFVLPLPAGHRFPMRKYALLRGRVTAAVGPDHELCVPPAAADEDLLRVHTPDWVAAVRDGLLERAAVRRIGFPWSPEMVERSRRSVGATMAATRAALHDGWSVNLAGGTHHAFADRAEGFCVFNDVAVAARAAQAETGVRRIGVIDCDVHQGNGTAAIFAHDSDVFTLSVHGRSNFPFHKESSDLDIALPDGAEDDEYLSAVRAGVQAALSAAPDLVYYVAGADPFADDRLGRLAVTKTGLAERDRVVFDACGAADVPVVTVMSGGYARKIEDTVDIHAHTVLSAAARASTVSTRR